MSRNHHTFLFGLLILSAPTLNSGSVRNRSTRPNQINTNTNLCTYSVPTITLKSFPNARRLRNDGHFTQIQYCCGNYVPYIIEGNRDFVCLPKCEKCQNGFCRAPGECICYDGFVKNDADECVFSCPVGCLNGQCFLDGTCRCNRGYKLSDNRDFCKPICTIECGENQTCTAPETCSCSDGYTLTSFGCAPVCNPPCGIGGKCDAPNVCICYKSMDYELRNDVCQARCYQRCDNGICIEPNRCICYPGFKYNEAAQTCIPDYI